MIKWFQFILILLFTLVSVFPMTAQWKEVPLFVDSSFVRYGNGIFDIEFSTDSTAVAIGQHSPVLYTSTYGEIWHQVQDLTDTSGDLFTGLYHIDTSQFIITGNRTVFRSFDHFDSFQSIDYSHYTFLGFLGGLSVRVSNEFHFLSIWRNVYIVSDNFGTNYFKGIGGLDSSNVAAVLSALEVFWVNDTTGYILSSSEFLPSYVSSVIHRTRDGGQSWKNILEGFHIMDIHFFNDSCGIGYDGFQLFTTTDYGDTWDWELLPIQGWNNNGVIPHPLEIVNDSVWYIYSNSDIIRTEDAGDSWQEIAPPDCGGCPIGELECPNDTTCFVGISPLGIYKTTNIKQLITGMRISKPMPVLDPNLYIYPNPAHSQITIKGLAGYVHPRLTVTNTLGQVIYQELVANKTLQLSVSHWPSGIYLVTVEEDGRPVATGKFVVE